MLLFKVSILVYDCYQYLLISLRICILVLWFCSFLLNSCFLFFFLLVLLLVCLFIFKSGTLETQLKSLSTDEALPLWSSLIWLGHFLGEVLMLSLELSFWDTQIPQRRLPMSCLEVLTATLGRFSLFLFFQLGSTYSVSWLLIKIILSHLNTIYI